MDIQITDTVPVAVADTRTVNEDDTGITGNVISGVNANADTVAADGGTVTGVQAGVASTAITGGANTAITGTYGDLTINSDGSYSYVTNAAAQALNAGESETDTFSYTLSDSDGDSSTVTVTFTVEGSDDTPQVSAGQVQTNEDTVYIFDLSDFPYTDPNGDAIASVTIESVPGSGTLEWFDGLNWTTVSESQVISASDIQAGGLRYVPEVNAPQGSDDGSDSGNFTFSVSDGVENSGTATMTVSVVAVADTPELTLGDITTDVSNDSNFTLPSGNGLVIDRFTNVPTVSPSSAADADVLEGALSGLTPNSQQVINQLGDGNTSADAEFIPLDGAVRVTGLIYLEPGDYSVSGYQDDTLHIEIGGNVLRSEGHDTWGAYNSSTLTVTESGYYTFELYAYNGASTTEGWISALISANGGSAQTLDNYTLFTDIHAVADAGGQYSAYSDNGGDGGYYPVRLNEGLEDTPIQLQDIAASLTDTDGSETLALLISELPEGSVLSDGSNSFTATSVISEVDVTGWNLATLTITPPADFTGSFDLSVTATATETSNGSFAEVTESFTVVVLPAPEAVVPDAVNDSFEVVEDGVLAANVSQNDTASADAPNVYSVAPGDGPANGSLSMNPDGSFTYTPNPDFNGSDTFTYTVTDGNGDTDTAIVSIDVTPENDTPEASVDSGYTIVEGGTLNLTASVLDNDSDVDGDALSVHSVRTNTGSTPGLLAGTSVVIATALGGTVEVFADGTFNYTAPVLDHSIEDPRQDSFEYRATDGSDESSWTTVTIDVSDTAPVAQDDSVEVDYAGQVSGNVITDLAGADTLSADPLLAHQVVEVTVGGVTYDAADRNASGEWVINADYGQFTVRQNGDYTYQSTQDLSVVTVGGSSSSGWAGVNLYGIDRGDAFRNGSGALISTNFDANSVTYIADGIGVDGSSNASWDNAYVNNQGGSSEALVVDLTESALSATVIVNSIQWGEYGTWFAFDADNNFVGSDTFGNVGGTPLAVEIAPGDDFQYLVFTSNTDWASGFSLGSVSYQPALVEGLVDNLEYTLEDADGSTSSATLTVSHDSEVSDGDESITINENSNIGAGQFNLLDNAVIENLAEVTSVNSGSIQIRQGGANITNEFTIDAIPGGSGVAEFLIAHEDGYRVGRLVVDDDGEVTFTNTSEHVFDFLAQGESAELTFDYTVNIAGTTLNSTATINVTGVNDAPVAVDDSGFVEGAFSSQFWLYEESAGRPNLETIAQVFNYANNNAPDAIFTTTGLDYGVADGDLGGNGNLASWIGSDAASLEWQTPSGTQERTAQDSIVRFNGVFNVANSGDHTFTIQHDDGFIVLVDGEAVVLADFITPPTTTTATVNLSAGTHNVEIYYWDQGGDYVFDAQLLDGSGNNIWVPGNMAYNSGGIAATENTDVTIDVLANDWDVDGSDNFSIQSVGSASNGSVVINPNGTLTYTPNANFVGQDSFQYTIVDNHGATSSATVTIDVQELDVLPVLDLDANDSTATGNDFATSVLAGESVALVDSDLLLSNESNLLGATFTLTNPADGDSLSVDGVLPTGITATYFAADGELVLSGTASVADYQAALAQVRYNAGDGTDSSDRVITVVVDDATGSSGTATATVSYGPIASPMMASFSNQVEGTAGDDLLEATSDMDTLSGLAGADTFAWSLGDQGSAGAPAEDVILDFNASEGDRLDLSDLLQGEEAGDLTEYLHFEQSGSDTIVHISSSGGYSSGYNASQTDQTITLEGVSLSGSDSDIITQLLNNGQLSVDQ